ncbi:hypothetical protein H6G76_21475 [Nostoc sp. FACHB-152]|uniref:hypothetical protein n=1 Tax=unclassified Nostoc TaxID=2593658 RepID=UPI0016863115|nr:MULTISPECIES: hypothetical protein [unclassified Nostoc]MBD2449691.1 hypothetical protein [Nostoc sp. FACHB-152]MBD2469089.1 hypothetical protein [Nostoc sp. FACHB-145]
MPEVKQRVYLLTEQQRDALLNYLLNRPYREVAPGIEFLNKAPSTILNIEIPEEQARHLPTEQESKSPANTQEKVEIRIPSVPKG